MGFFQEYNNGNETDWKKWKKEMQYAGYKGTEHPQHTNFLIPISLQPDGVNLRT